MCSVFIAYLVHWVCVYSCACMYIYNALHSVWVCVCEGCIPFYNTITALNVRARRYKMYVVGMIAMAIIN